MEYEIILVLNTQNVPSVCIRAKFKLHGGANESVFFVNIV